MSGFLGSTGAIVAQALGISYAAGLSVYGTLAVLGLIVRIGWVASLPGALEGWTSGWVWGIAIALYLVEFTTTMVRGLAPAWETIHSLVRPPVAAILAATITWHRDPVLIVITAVLAGGMAVTTHTTKLGVRYICATSATLSWNGIENVIELGIIAAIGFLIWAHPFTTLGLAFGVLVLIVARVQLIWRTMLEVFTGRWKPSSEFLQEPRLHGRGRQHPEG
jgi:hypothetical protein